MRNLKKILALVLSLMMVLSVMVTASATDFADDADITNKEAVEVMSALGILNGYTDGSFGPKDTLERAQAAKIIAFIKLGVDTDDYLATITTNKFADVTGGWAMPYIAYCSNEGIIDGGKDADGVLKFDPKGTLQGYAFAKMILNVLGIEGDYTGPNWTLEVAKNLYGNKTLLKGLDKLVLSANITREQASQLALNAMNYTAGGAATGKYVVNVKAGGSNQPTGLDGDVFDSRTDALLTIKALYPSAVLDTDYTLTAQTDNTGSLADTVYGLSCDEAATDAYGRAMNVWTATKVGDEPVVVEYVTEAPVLTYDDPITSGDLYVDLGLKAGLAAAKVDVLVDNVSSGQGYDSFAIAEDSDTVLGAEGQSIEVYKTATGVKIILISTIYGTIASVDEAKGTVTVTGYNAYEATGYEVGDHVLFTYAKAKSGVDITSMEKVETITGTLTSYTKANVFTVNGQAYEVSGIAGVTKADVESNVKAAMGLEKVYGLDKAGKIIYVAEPTGETPTIPTNYAVVVDANVVVTTTPAVWPSNTETTTVTAQIMVLLSDGTKAIWDVPVALAKATITDATKGNVTEGHYYVTVAGKYIDLGATPADCTKNLKTALDTVYTYADEALVSAVPTLTKSETASGAALYAPDSTVQNTTYASDGVILNNNTVFILKDANDNIVVKTGLAALENTQISSGAKIVVDVAYDGKAAANNVNVAKVVFAQSTVFNGSAAAATSNYILLDGDYTTTVDANGDPVYTYSYTKVDGTVGTVAADAGLASGIYTLKTDGSVNTVGAVTDESTIGVVSGTTVYVDDTAMTTTSTTVVVGGELVKGAKAYVVSSSNVISLVFIVD